MIIDFPRKNWTRMYFCAANVSSFEEEKESSLFINRKFEPKNFRLVFYLSHLDQELDKANQIT